MSCCVAFISLLNIGLLNFSTCDCCFCSSERLQWCKKSDYVQIQHPPPIPLSIRAWSLYHTHRSEAYPFYKNCKSNPFNRDTEWLPKNVLFTTLRLNRKYTAFPPHAVENEFPMSGGMQSGACVFLAILIYSELRQRNQ